MKNLIRITVLTLLLTSSFCLGDIVDPSNTTLETTVSTPATTASTSAAASTTQATTTTPLITTTASTTPVITATASTTPVITATASTTPVITTTTSTTPETTTASTTQSTTTSASTTPATTTSINTTPVPITPAPPVPVVGSWNVTEGNTTCIRADLKIRFKIPVEDHFEYIALSPNASDEGSTCMGHNGTQVLRLTDSGYFLMMTFEKDSTNAYMSNVTFTYNLPDAHGLVYNDSHLFNVKIGNSYLCSSDDTVPLMNVTMEISHIHIQVFGSEGNSDFGTAEECESDNKVNDMVPIAVGCALLALVVIVLIAYFVGRRRSRQKGYQSV